MRCQVCGSANIFKGVSSDSFGHPSAQFICAACGWEWKPIGSCGEAPHIKLMETIANVIVTMDNDGPTDEQRKRIMEAMEYLK